MTRWLTGTLMLGLLLGTGAMPAATASQESPALRLAQQVPPAVPPGEPVSPTTPAPRPMDAGEPREAAATDGTRVWIGIGIVALALLAVATVLSVRGRGRTVLKE
jgi:hypothetical protein